MIEVNLDLSEARIVLERAGPGFQRDRPSVRGRGGKIFAVEVIALLDVPAQGNPALLASLGAEDECLVHVERPFERADGDGKQSGKQEPDHGFGKVHALRPSGGAPFVVGGTDRPATLRQA